MLPTMHYEPWAWELVGDVAVGVGEVVIFTPAGVDAHARGLHPPTRMHTHTQATTLIPGRRTARPPILGDQATACGILEWGATS